VKLNYEQIRMDGGTQPRSQLLIEVMEDYAEQMRAGVEFPPLTVFFDGKEYWLADGFHRLGAALRARPADPIEAEVIQGTQTEAQWYSFGVNKTHGLRRTRGDRVRAIQAALRHPEGAGKSNYEIAEHCGVSEITVRRYRQQLEPTTTMSQSSGQAGEDRKDRPAEARADHELLPWERPATRPAASRPRTGRDGRTINTAKIGKGKHKSPRAPSRHMAARIQKPTRAPNPMEKMTALSIPHNPVMGARTLIEVFDADYLRILAAEISSHLKGLEG